MKTLCLVLMLVVMGCGIAPRYYVKSVFCIRGKCSASYDLEDLSNGRKGYYVAVYKNKSEVDKLMDEVFNGTIYKEPQ